MDNMQQNSYFISAVGICKSFLSSGSRIDILKDLNFNLKLGETIAIVGASGIGKSTLLHILGTLDKPTSGQLFYRKQNVLEYDSMQLAKFRNETIGFVFQFHHLLSEFSALENTMIPAMIKGLSPQLCKEYAENILIRVGLKDRLNHLVGELSGGEQQRVALARALVLKPPILLADEPTGNLDTKNSEQVHELLLDLNAEFRMTLVVVTHNMRLAECMSRRVTISDGLLVEQE